jgi:transposase
VSRALKTAARLATYLEKVTGIKLSSSQISRILHKKKHVYIWAKYSLESKQNPIKREVFKQKLSEYLIISFINTRAFTAMVLG